jgi:hypothetical protein
MNKKKNTPMPPILPQQTTPSLSSSVAHQEIKAKKYTAMTTEGSFASLQSMFLTEAP